MFSLSLDLHTYFILWTNENAHMLSIRRPSKKRLIIGPGSNAMQLILLFVVTLSTVIAKPIQEITGVSSIPVSSESPGNNLKPSTNTDILHQSSSDGHEIAGDSDFSVDAEIPANKLEPAHTAVSDQPNSDIQDSSLKEANSIIPGQPKKGVYPAKSPPYCPALYTPACCTGFEFGSGFRGKCKLCMFSISCCTITRTETHRAQSVMCPF